MERNLSSPSILVKYAGYKQLGLFLRYYSDSKEKRAWVQNLKGDIQKCCQGQYAIPMLSFPVNEFKSNISIYFCVKNITLQTYEDKRSQGFYQNKSDQDINTGIDFTPMKIKGLASMVETNDLFCTPSENFLHISPATITKNTFKLEESKRSVAVLGDWAEGLGFGINQAVWTNIPKTVVGP